MTVDPFTALAVTLRDNAVNKTKEVLSGVAVELGTITASGLKLDRFKHEIGDYYVAEFPGILKLPELKLAGTVTGLKDSGGGGVQGKGNYSFEASETKESSLKLEYQPGDRVLVIPFNGGHDSIVICKVVNRGG
ncbi:hypothetical protein QYF50_04135 [Paenibacillus vini]|uniref:hypothetical protein n=1 Tax=Paenibacillus vini TaxID=1476024 RepID=UPI0025B6AEC2|nr:hypothetical protein [Paenibacillus vini]MDN4067076.1 hypothetical protein [Paenibacillus vini]